VANFREVLDEGYITKISTPKYKYKKLNLEIYYIKNVKL
jgi:hypothetical protein